MKDAFHPEEQGVFPLHFIFFLSFFFILRFILNVDRIWVNNLKMGERKVWLSMLRVSKLITILIFVSWDTEIFNYVK